MFGVGVGIRVGGRTAVSSGGGFDPDAQAFFDRVTTAGGTLTTTEKNATNQLVLDMKSAGIWSSMKAVYPMVGASAAACAQNLKSSSFTGTFSSGWTFASSGATPNGTSAYMDTTFVPNTNLTKGDGHYSYYSRTNSATTSSTTMGSQSNGRGRLILRRTGDNAYMELGTSGVSSNSYSVSDSRCYAIISVISNGDVKFFKNGILQTSSTALASNDPWTDVSITLGAAQNIGQYDDKQCAFASIGDGLTDTQAGNFYTAVQAFQTTLNRYVDAPWYNNGNLLLDDYPSASAAYSVRKLRNNYIGGPIRVRRSSDNAEQDIYFDANGNLDTAQLTSFCGAGNGFVTTWYDQSGNGLNEIQTTAANQPKIVNAGALLTANGKPAILFDGANDRLSNTTAAITTTSSAIFDVSRPTALNGSDDNVLFAQYNAAPGRFIFAFNLISGNFRLRIFEGGGLGNIYGSTNIATNTTYLSSMINNNKSVTGYLNGTSQMTGTFTSTPPNTPNFIAAYDASGGFFTGYQSEVVVYNSNQSSNLSGIQTNINSYYGIY